MTSRFICILMCVCTRARARTRVRAHARAHAQGVAHYLEHLVFLGTEKWRTAEEMKELMASLGMSFGGDTNASTDHCSTIYTMEAPAGDDNVRLVVEILYQMMFKALLLEACVDSERGPILSEKQMRNTIDYRRGLQMMGLMHARNRIPTRLPIGLERLIKGFTADDLRRFYSKWYYAANMTLYVAGVFSPSALSAADSGSFFSPLSEHADGERRKILPTRCVTGYLEYGRRDPSACRRRHAPCEGFRARAVEATFAAEAARPPGGVPQRYNLEHSFAAPEADRGSFCFRRMLAADAIRVSDIQAWHPERSR